MNSPLQVKTFLIILAFIPVLGQCRDGLIVGMELSYPPFEMTDQKGEPSGVSVELAKALGQALSKEVLIQNMSFDGLIPALKTGKIDLIISSMTATPERAQSIDFSEPYLQTGLCLLVGKQSKIQSVQDSDRPGLKIAVKKGTTAHQFAAKHFKNAGILVFDKESAAVLEVIQRKADAFIYDQMSVYSNWQRNQDTTLALLQPFEKESWAIGLRKGQDDLRLQINSFLKDFKAQGGFDRLAEIYLKDQKQGFERLGFPFVF